jgi:hypothetical protein
MMKTMHQTDQDIQANVTEEMLYDPSCEAGDLKVTSQVMLTVQNTERATLDLRGVRIDSVGSTLDIPANATAEFDVDVLVSEVFDEQGGASTACSASRRAPTGRPTRMPCAPWHPATRSSPTWR